MKRKSAKSSELFEITAKVFCAVLLKLENLGKDTKIEIGAKILEFKKREKHGNR